METSASILDTPADLADLCRSLREAAGLSQAQLAEAIGETRLQMVSKAESRTEPSRFAVRARILQHFGYAVREAYVVTKAPSAYAL